MVEKELIQEDWNDRSNWRKKILLLSNGRKKCGNIVHPAK